MGIFYVEAGIGRPAGGDFRAVTPLVDTGAIHSLMPASLLGELGLAPDEWVVFTLADGNTVEYGYGEARFAIAGRQRTCPVIFGPEGQYLLGATTLEAFNLIADTANGRLAPATRLTL